MTTCALQITCSLVSSLDRFSVDPIVCRSSSFDSLRILAGHFFHRLSQISFASRGRLSHRDRVIHPLLMLHHTSYLKSYSIYCTPYPKLSYIVRPSWPIRSLCGSPRIYFSCTARNVRQTRELEWGTLCGAKLREAREHARPVVRDRARCSSQDAVTRGSSIAATRSSLAASAARLPFLSELHK